MTNEIFCHAHDNFTLCYNELKQLKDMLEKKIDPRFEELNRRFDDFATIDRLKKGMRKFDELKEKIEM